MTILDEIVAKKRLEIEAIKAARPLEVLQKEAESFKTERRSFRKLFDRGSVLIAEIKPKPPSEGMLIREPPLDIADLYAKSSADVFSVLSDKPYFGGEIEVRRRGKARVPQEIFRKDFIVDEYQVYETLLSGADAFLLIANVLSVEELGKLMALGQALGLDYLVEVHDEADVAKALETGAEIIGINNRNLKTLEVDIETTERLSHKLPSGTIFVSESGIETTADAERVRTWGACGILAGTSILRSPDPLKKIQELKNTLN